MTIRQGRIDVHHHIIPPDFVSAMERRGIARVAGAPLPRWSPEKSIAVMDTNGIQTAITSLSAPGVYFGDKDEARDLARNCNEFAAGLREDYPGRFGSFAVLPMPFADLACREAGYALDTLGADGVVLLGSTNGVFLGDPCLDELMSELNSRGATVFVHPNLHATSEQLGLDIPGFLVEFLCDTTRAAINLILKGVMERYPSIRWILAHAGGFLPYIAWRISLANHMPEISKGAPQGVLSYMKRFYFDTALSPSSLSLAPLLELAGPSRILFGSDFPFAPAPLTTLCCKTLEESTLLDTDAQYGVARANSLGLFPRYKLDGEEFSPTIVFKGESTRQKARRLLSRPVTVLAESIRNR